MEFGIWGHSVCTNCPNPGLTINKTFGLFNSSSTMDGKLSFCCLGNYNSVTLRMVQRSIVEADKNQLEIFIYSTDNNNGVTNGLIKDKA